MWAFAIYEIIAPSPLGQGQYKKLEYTKDSAAHTSNDVIARQTDCPTSLTLHEHYAFGCLRAGHRLQWLNLRRELMAQVLNFNHKEVQTLIVHTICQAGPRGDGGVSRESHLPLDDVEFLFGLLVSLIDAFCAIEQNWQSVVGIQTFTTITKRVLSVTASAEFRAKCFTLLRRARFITQKWTRQLNSQLQEAEEKNISQLTALALEAALTCYETFDIDQHFPSSLLATDDGFADILECAVIIHDRRPPTVDQLCTHTRDLLCSYLRTSHQTTLFLFNYDIQSGFHCAACRVWAGYIPIDHWTPVNDNEPWFVTQTSGGYGSNEKVVHYNILSGQLLVDGFPVARLPKEYDSHTSYARLFGKVSPTRYTLHGYHAT